MFVMIMMAAAICALGFFLGTVASIDVPEAQAGSCLGPPAFGAYPEEDLNINVALVDDPANAYRLNTFEDPHPINELTVICRAGTVYVRVFGEYHDSSTWRQVFAGQGRIISRCSIDSVKVKAGETGGIGDIELRGGF